VPNIEHLLFKIFCSPMATRDQRAGDKDLLAGNIFAQKKMQLPLDVYRSLLQTLAVRPKKKHFKKVVEYLTTHEPVSRLTPQLLDQIIAIGISHSYPVTLGQIVRNMVSQLDCNIHRSSYMKFVMFLESCKGFEDDAKKFLFLVQHSSHL